jgi:hypothetical protein
VQERVIQGPEVEVIWSAPLGPDRLRFVD